MRTDDREHASDTDPEVHIRGLASARTWMAEEEPLFFSQALCEVVLPSLAACFLSHVVSKAAYPRHVKNFFLRKALSHGQHQHWRVSCFDPHGHAIGQGEE